MESWKSFILISCLLMFSVCIHQDVDAQENLAQEAYAIFEQSCLNCHGEHGAYTEQLIIEHAALVAPGGAVIPGNPDDSEFYKRLVEERVEKRMPLGQPPLSDAAIDTIQRWILAGAPDWRNTFASDSPFVTPQEMLEVIENHVNSLPPFDRAFARYFTLTHLYNAGETTEDLHAYQRALSKLVNSLSWGREIVNPQPVDSEETIFYIDLRDYEWEVGINRWTLIEAEYPYKVEFNAPTQTTLHEKLMNLREEMSCEVPFIHVDWFLANASLPALYHDILDLPRTDRALEAKLGVDVVSNLRNAAGKRVWRAGFNDSGVSNNNRVVERHQFQHGAYWKSYDFAGSVGTQYIFTHPLAFTHDGGEIIFNLPNGLQAYYLVDAGGNRLDAAPIDIVRNPAASDPTVRNGLSCIGCHTEGMKTFKDQVRGVVEQNENPPFDKDRVLRLYIEKSVMDAFVEEDTNRYRQALEKTGGVFGSIEPVQRFHEAFQRPLDAVQAAAAVGLETQDFLQKIRQNTSLQHLGLLVLGNGTVKRDTWTEQFSEVVFALDFPERSQEIPIEQQTERIPGESVYIPDSNLRTAIEEALGKAPGTPITVEDMETWTTEFRADSRNISDLTGLEFATNQKVLSLANNSVSDLSPLAKLTNLEHLVINGNLLSDLFPLAGLTNLKSLHLYDNPTISDVSPLAGLINLEILDLGDSNFKSKLDLSELAGLSKIPWLAGGPKLEGPWLWVMVPIGDIGAEKAASSGIDWLSEASGGKVTEQRIATKGATEGKPVGNMVWTTASLATKGNTINEMANTAGLGVGDIDYHVAYGSLVLYSSLHQNTKMYVGSDDGVKVWLNGELVHNNPAIRFSDDYNEKFPVTLKQGINLLLVAVYEEGGWWTGFFGFEPDAAYTVIPPSTGFTFSTEPTSVRVGDPFTLHIGAKKITDLAGWQFDLVFDPTALEAIAVNDGDFLKIGDGTTFFQKGIIDNTAGEITELSSALISASGVSGTGTLLSVTFATKVEGETQIALRNFELGSISGAVIPSVHSDVVIKVEDQFAWDVNRDGRVSILDLILVSQHLGSAASANSKFDVNGDGIINIQDLILVAQHLGESMTSAAPSTLTGSIEGLDPAMIQAWIEQAELENDGSIAFQQGIANLQWLLASLIPEETALLPNYPNPFNPETWIPYQLLEPSEVTVNIYTVNGELVRTLALGHKFAGIYQSRTRAAYWDGKNDLGEHVASGIYFYTLTAGEFIATRKMLIRK
ncbi:MAG: leucine-rich repeat domain-containing protein [Candidatus Poribacteria bacterium]|nr:leucine-rich repeat domain-containing protein [Candidatus Poribacteria bacterium]